METIGTEKLRSFNSKGRIQERSCFSVRRDGGLIVKDFLDLAQKVAELAFRNPNYIMLFRGQYQDFKRTNTDGKEFSSLSPSLFRKIAGRNPTSADLTRKFSTLKAAELSLVEKYEKKKFGHAENLKRQQILRWTILQHYEVCDTPLLDVTHSLRVAASFASDPSRDEAFVYVLGVPHLSGAITASAEAGIQVVRLSSVCPPEALRPHIQEGYLLGEYPEMSDYSQKQNYGHYEIDFGRRLVAKFQFNPKEFWQRNTTFPKIPREALYPDKSDKLFKLAHSVKENVEQKI